MKGGVPRKDFHKKKNKNKNKNVALYYWGLEKIEIKMCLSPATHILRSVANII